MHSRWKPLCLVLLPPHVRSGPETCEYLTLTIQLGVLHLLYPEPQCLRQFLPLKHAMRKMIKASTTTTAAMMSFIFMFCHHILLRSWRPVLWNLSACSQDPRSYSALHLFHIHLASACRHALWASSATYKTFWQITDMQPRLLVS